MLERNEKIIKRKMLQYILPGIMLTAALQVGNVVDSMLVGNLLGPDAMSAVKIGMAVDNIVELPGYVLGVGGSVAAGIFMGNRETEKAKKVFSTTFLISLLFGLIFAALSVGSGYYAKWLCGGSSLVADAESFIFVTMLIAPVLSAALQLINYVAVDNNPTLASVYVITANVLNLTLDYVLLKFTDLGTAGAALSTGLGYGIALFLMIFYVRSKKRMLSFVNPFGDMKPHLLAALKAGIPTLLYMIFLTIKDMSLNTMIIKMVGETAMIIYTVCFNATLCVQMCAGGIVGLLSNMGSVLYGKRDFFGIKRLIRHLLRYSYIVLGVFMVVMLAKPGLFLGFFGVTDAATAVPGAAALRIYTLALPFYLWNHFMMVYYQSTDKTVLSSIITSLQTCVAIVPLAFVFVIAAKAWGLDTLNAMVLSFVFSEIVTIVITFVYQRIKYKKQSYFMLPKHEEETVDFTVNGDPDQINETIDMIFNYCKDRDIPRKTANRMAMVTEEILYNVFRQGNAENADVAMYVVGGTLSLRLTDDGVPFNPLEYKPEENEPVTQELDTIKLIASRTEYLRVIDLNYTTIEIDTKTLMNQPA